MQLHQPHMTIKDDGSHIPDQKKCIDAQSTLILLSTKLSSLWTVFDFLRILEIRISNLCDIINILQHNYTFLKLFNIESNSVLKVHIAEQ